MTYLEQRLKDFALSYQQIERSRVTEGPKPEPHQFFIFYAHEEMEWPPQIVGIWGEQELQETLDYFQETGLLRIKKCMSPASFDPVTWDYEFIDPLWIQVVKPQKTLYKIFEEKYYKDETEYRLKQAARALKVALSQEPQAIERPPY